MAALMYFYEYVGKGTRTLESTATTISSVIGHAAIRPLRPALPWAGLGCPVEDDPPASLLDRFPRDL